MTKKCCTCKIEKDVSEFGGLKRTKDGLNPRCKECGAKYYLESNSRLKEIRYQRGVEFRRNNKDRLLEVSRKYVAEHKEEKAAYDKIYRQKNAKKFAEYKRAWTKRNRNRPEHKIKKNLRRRIHHAIKDGRKSARTIELLGCSVEEFMKHLESLWEVGMSWDNYGLHGWHIDHIIPCSAFDLTDPEQQKRCFHYTNCRPMWQEDNLKKSYIFNGINCMKIQDKSTIIKPDLLIVESHQKTDPF